MNANWSANNGVEGGSGDLVIEERRNRQVKNFLATLLLSIGTPMLLGGDEIRRTQRGNNNAYCQDNETSWYDWSFASGHRDILDFCSALIRFRKKHPALRRPEFFTGLDNDSNQLPDITWFDERGRPPDWASINHTLAALIDGSKTEFASRVSDDDFYLMFNASAHPVSFTIPRHPRGLTWNKVIDTAAKAPDDIIREDSRETLPQKSALTLAPRALVVLLAPKDEPTNLG